MMFQDPIILPRWIVYAGETVCHFMCSTGGMLNVRGERRMRSEQSEFSSKNCLLGTPWSHFYEQAEGSNVVTADF